jgi:hypothetical protein
MGLDTYAAPNEEERLSVEDIKAFETAGIKLTVGILSNSPGSFRGKVYIPLIEVITGQSLHQYWIPQYIVNDMYQKFTSCQLGNFPGQEESIRNLTKFFKVCVDRHLGLANYW